MATSQPLGFFAQYTVTTVAALGLALYTAWDLALVTLAIVPLSALVLGWVSSRMQPSIKAQMDELTQASKLANNAISSIDNVKYFNGQDFEIWQYARKIRKAASFYLTQAQYNALQIGLVRFMTSIMFVQGFWYGSHLVAIGKRNPGQILTAFWACLIATQTVEQILPQMIILEKGRASGATLQEMLRQMESGRKVVNMTGRTPPQYCEGDIEIRNVSAMKSLKNNVVDSIQVSFKYPSRPNFLALDQASFFLPAGETTFVVGKSGSGKSTLGNLLMRYYGTISGDVLVDGKSIYSVDIKWLRNNVTLVQQESVLFNETIFKNIAFARRDHDQVRREEVKRTINTANLQQTINELPNGLDTFVGVGGSALSGGQKQRVAIARARLRDTPILILDESTSALDHLSRVMVMNKIREWRKGKTTIIITHDMSQIEGGDFLYVMEDGKIAEEGFRKALEQTSSGAFLRLLQSEAASPCGKEQTIEGSTRFSRSPDQGPLSPASPIVPDALSDTMDFQFQPRRRLIPSIFGAPETEEFRSLKTLQSPVLPLSPGAFTMNRLIVAPTSPRAFPSNRFSLVPTPFVAPRRRISQPIEHLKTLSALSEQPEFEYSPKIIPTRVSRMLETAGIVSRDSISARRRSSTIPLQPRHDSVQEVRESAPYIAPIKKILLTIWPTLTWEKRMLLIFGFCFATIHAAATPVFSWLFSKLLSTFYLQEDRAKTALMWSLSVIGVAFGDSIASYMMHYCLENCGQAWIDTLRIEAMKRVIDQPRSWFDRDENSLTKLTESLDRNAEEMRNLLGRFAAFVYVAFLMIGMSVIWSLAVCWKLTLVSLSAAPFMYGLTHTFETVSGNWERKSNDAGGTASAIFTETFGNIRTVRALTLEPYFHKKYVKATEKAMMVGIRRSAIAGLFFGLSDSGIVFITGMPRQRNTVKKLLIESPALIFYYGSKLASSREFSIENILTVFTQLLFSIANANNIVAFSRSSFDYHFPGLSDMCQSSSDQLIQGHCYKTPALGQSAFPEVA